MALDFYPPWSFAVSLGAEEAGPAELAGFEALTDSLLLSRLDMDGLLTNELDDVF
jgi:hypothetical protein